MINHMEMEFINLIQVKLNLMMALGVMENFSGSEKLPLIITLN